MAKVSDDKSNNGAKRKLGNVRDFRHASYSYVSDPGYTNAPKFGFSFHVRMVFEQVGVADPITLSILVKSVDLPRFNVEVDTLNKYNKKEVFQKKITYEPVNILFHDDRNGTIRNLWRTYNQYYFADSNITAQAYEIDDTYSPVRLATRYGLDNDIQGRFLKSVEIYSMGDHVYNKYTLINPMISSFDFDTHDYADGSKIMQASMRLEYENVLYADGVTEAIPGFGVTSPYYDNAFSDLKPGFNPVPQTRKQVDFIEQERVSRPRPIPISNFDQQPVVPVRVSKQQQKQIKVNAANSLQRNRRFSFPTATEINNLSNLVDIDAQLRIKQGVVNRSNNVTSNGATVASSQQSSIGQYTVNNELTSSLIIAPRIPAGLTAAEQAAFLESYPPLPSSDARTRSAPYV